MKRLWTNEDPHRIALKRRHICVYDPCIPGCEHACHADLKRAPILHNDTILRNHPLASRKPVYSNAVHEVARKKG